MKKDKEVEINHLTTKMAQIEANMKIAKLEADLMEGRERNRELERKIAEKKRKNDDLEAQLRAQNTEVSDGKVNIGELKGKINALQSKNSDLETQIRFEMENKTNEMVKLQADLIRTMTGVLDLNGWSYLAKTVSWYKAIDQKMTFDEAEAYCASRKGHLVTIHTQEENDFVRELAYAVSSNRFWIGLKKSSNKGNAFEWTNESSVDFINWCSGYPVSNTHAWLCSYNGPWTSSSPTDQLRFICKTSSQF